MAKGVFERGVPEPSRRRYLCPDKERRNLIGMGKLLFLFDI